MVWDLETVPDLEGYARANGLIGRSPEEIRTAIGPDFPKLIYHSIVCIGALVASRRSNGYEVQVVGAPHIGQRTEKELIEAFTGKIAQVSPKLVTFNGAAFDLPVLRYRAMIHGVFAPGMHNRAYYHRYTDDCVDLCDVLSSFSYGGKVKLDELSSDHGSFGKTWRDGRVTGRGLLQRRSHPGDSGLLQIRRRQYVPALASARAFLRPVGPGAVRVQ